MSDAVEAEVAAVVGLSEGLRRFGSGLEAAAGAALAEVVRGQGRVQAALARSQQQVVRAQADHEIAVRDLTRCQAGPQNDCRPAEAAVRAARERLQDAQVRHAENTRCAQVYERAAGDVQRAVRDLRDTALPRIGPARTTLSGLADRLRAYLKAQVS